MLDINNTSIQTITKEDEVYILLIEMQQQLFTMEWRMGNTQHKNILS